MKYQAVIGLEIHVQMKTRSKMFSSSPVSFGATPNTKTSINDMAFPGALPLVNKQAVINAIRVCHALHMEIDNELWFDRKNYFYSDLPKGYQITQNDRPIGKNGYVSIDTPQGEKIIKTMRLHLEEDACKQTHYSDYSLIDYNRAGIPLLEIVSYPEISNGEEAMKYVEKIRSIVTFLDVSNGKMEEGSLLVDVNVSIKEEGKEVSGNKVEIKNINTLSNIQKAIDYEIARQIEIVESSQKVIQETMRFDEKSGKTIPMRLKMDSIDYKFFTETNLLPIKLSDEFIANAIRTSPELAEVKKKRYMSLGLNDYDSSQLVAHKEVSIYFDEVIAHGANPKLAANWINVEVQRILNKGKISIEEFSLSPDRLASLIKLIEEGKISHKQAKEVFLKAIDSDISINQIIVDMGIVLMNDEEEIKSLVKQVIDENPQVVIDYKNGKDRAVMFVIGRMMKLTGGKVNPELTNRLVLEELQRR